MKKSKSKPNWLKKKKKGKNLKTLSYQIFFVFNKRIIKHLWNFKIKLKVAHSTVKQHSPILCNMGLFHYFTVPPHQY